MNLNRNRTLLPIAIAADGPVVTDMDIADYFGALLQIRSVGSGLNLTVYGDLTAAKTGSTQPLCVVKLDAAEVGFPIKPTTEGNGMYWVPACNSLSIVASNFADPAELIICLLGSPWVPPAQYF